MMLLIGFGYLFFCSLLPSLLSVVLVRFLPGSMNTHYAILSFVTGIVYVWILYAKFGEQMEPGKNITVLGVIEALVTGFLLFFAVNFFISPALEMLFPASGENYTQSVEQMFQTPIPTFFQLVIVAPLMEELIFRGFLLKRALRWRKTWVAVLLVAAVFGLLHLSFVQGFSALAAGIFLCLLYVWKQSVGLCILAHGLFNGLAFFLVLLSA
jgi:membrane protease YdiL (CAAX protease family)